MSRVVFWNPGPPNRAHPDTLCDRVLGGLAREYRPRAMVLAETVGRRFQPLPGYQQVRAFVPAGRANLTVFYREDCHHKRTWWADLSETWTRWDGTGRQHPARSIVVVSLGTVQLVGAHQPPQGTDNTEKAQHEGIAALARIMAPFRGALGHVDAAGIAVMRARPRVLLWDPNRAPDDDGPGPRYLRSHVGGHVLGGKTDGALVRGELTATPAVVGGMVDHAGGVAIPTDDHKGALVLNITLGKGQHW